MESTWGNFRSFSSTSLPAAVPVSQTTSAFLACALPDISAISEAMESLNNTRSIYFFSIIIKGF
jgi:hypothetical protein